MILTTVWILEQCPRHSFIKYSTVPLEAHVNLDKPGCIRLSKKRILSLNNPLSSIERAAMIL